MFQRIALKAALCVLLATPGIALAQEGSILLRSRNALELPIREPIAVEIFLPQPQLYAAEVASNPMMSGGLIYGVADSIRSANLEGAFGTVVARMPQEDYDSVLKAAFARRVGAEQLANVTRVTVHHVTPGQLRKTDPGNPDEMTLALEVRYYLDASLSTLRIGMTAVVGERRNVLPTKDGDASLPFVQHLSHDVPGNTRTFAAASTRAATWVEMGGPATAEHIKTGMDEVMAMLASELATRPRFGRITGRQIAWNEGGHSTYGVVEKIVSGRRWLRLRNGRLVSLPGDNGHL